MQQQSSVTYWVFGIFFGAFTAMLCGPCACFLPVAAIVAGSRYAPGALVGYFLGLCLGVVAMQAMGGMAELQALVDSGAVSPGGVRKVTFDGSTPATRSDPMLPVLLIAAGGGVLISVVGVAGAAWMLVNGGDDEDEPEHL